MEILFKDYFKEQFEKCITGYQNRNANDGELDLIIEAYNEVSIDPKNDINITVKRLQGTQINDTVSMPYQIMFTLSIDLYQELKGAFEYFVESYNEKTCLIKTDDGTFVSVYPTYSPHYVLSTNADLGEKQGVIVTISATLVYGINGKEAVKCKKVSIGLYNNGIVSQKEEIAVMSIGVGTSYNTTTTGKLSKGNEQVASNQSVLPIYTMALIPFISVKYVFNEEEGKYEPVSENSIIGQILSNIVEGKNINQLYYLEMPIGSMICTKICKLTNPSSYNDNVSGYPNLTISFVKGLEESDD